MILVGLTGSIGMGKSTVAKMFNDLGIKIWSADKAVHDIYQNDITAKEELANVFGDIFDEKQNIDRQKLSLKVLKDKEKLANLEAIVHPKVRMHRENFINIVAHENAPYVILDIPLLFETRSKKEVFDKIIVVNCSIETQKKRVLARPKMSEEKFKAILQNQMPNSEKVKKADFVIDTDQSLDETLRAVHQIHEVLVKL